VHNVENGFRLSSRGEGGELNYQTYQKLFVNTGKHERLNEYSL